MNRPDSRLPTRELLRTPGNVDSATRYEHPIDADTGAARPHLSHEANAGPVAARRVSLLRPQRGQTCRALEIAFVLSGALHLSTSSFIADVREGHILILPAKMMWKADSVDHLSAIVLYVVPRFIIAQLPWFPRLHPLSAPLRASLSPAATPALVDLGACGMRKLAHKLNALAAADTSIQGRFGLLAQLSDLMQDLQPRGHSTGLTDQGAWLRAEVLDAMQLLELDPAHQWDVQRLARAVNLSPAQLTRLFGQELGISPAAFLSQVRVERMAEILTTTPTTMTVAEAARQTGWSSGAAASRAFARHFGASPRSFAQGAVELGCICE